MHDNLADIYDNRKKSRNTAVTVSKPYYNFKDPFYKNKFIQMQLISEKRKKTNREESDKLFYGPNFGFNIEDYMKMLRLLGQLEQPFEDLIKLIDKYVDEEYRINVIYDIVNSILRSSRPIQSLKETTESYKSLECLDKIAFYIAKHDNMAEEEAKEKLFKIVKESKHFKRIIN